MNQFFAPIKFLIGRLAFLLLFITFIFPTIFCVSGLSDKETIKQTETSAPLSRENSAHLARVLQLRQGRDTIAHRKREERGKTTANTRTNNGKPKRYKCFLVDDNDSEENLAQQKSYFAKFQDRHFIHQKRPADILGWEEGLRRSEGARYLYAATKGTTTPAEPIIEYIDEGDDVEEAEETRSSSTTPTVAEEEEEDTAEHAASAALAPQQTTMSGALAPKQHFSKQTAATTATISAMHSKIAEESQHEEDYVDELGADLYIATTTRKPIQQNEQHTVPAMTHRAQPKMPIARSIPGTVFDGGTNKIEDEKPEEKPRQFVPDVKIKASMRPFNVPMSNKAERTKGITRENDEKDKVPTERKSEETEEQKAQQLIRITPLRKGATDRVETEETKPQQQHTNNDLMGQQISMNEPKQRTDTNELQTMAPTQNVPHDAQGRPLILSPEHCKMVEHYSSLYGVKDVRSFVHNNCAFAKMYLPTATCAEIDILIASCYQPRSDRQRKKKRRH